MSDLISRSALLEEFVEATNKGSSKLWHITGIKAFIENQPTVEAIPKSKLDEIVEQLKGSKIVVSSIVNVSSYNLAIRRAINIVKGVMNERD